MSDSTNMFPGISSSVLDMAAAAAPSFAKFDKANPGHQNTFASAHIVGVTISNPENVPPMVAGLLSASKVVEQAAPPLHGKQRNRTNEVGG